MTCRELVERLDAYLAGEGEPERRAECERHLARCRSCLAYLDSYRKTIALGRAAFSEEEGPVPPEVPEDLVQALLALRPRP